MSVEPPRDASDNIASNNEVTSTSLEDTELPDATHDSTTDEMADPEASSSLFADEETSVEPAVSNGGLQPDNDLAFASAVISSPIPRGSVTSSIEDNREAEPSDDAHYRESIGFSKQSTCSTDTVGFILQKCTSERQTLIYERFVKRNEGNLVVKMGGVCLTDSKSLVHDVTF